MELLKKTVHNLPDLTLGFFLASLFAPMWGVGYVIPFFILFAISLKGKNLFLVLKDSLECKEVRVILVVFVVFVFSVFVSSIVHYPARLSGEDGFWVALAVFVFYISGLFVGFISAREKLESYLKHFFVIATCLVAVTTSITNFDGGIWVNPNSIFPAVMYVFAASCGLFAPSLRNGNSKIVILILFLLIGYVSFFSFKVSSSDAAVFLCVAYLLFLFIVVPGEKAFMVFSFIFSGGLVVTTFLLVNGEAVHFEKVLDPKSVCAFLDKRPQLWLQSLAVIQANPWFGIGSGNFMEGYRYIQGSIPKTMVWLGHTHCIYFHYFVSSGFFAGFSFISLVVLNLRQVIAALHEDVLFPFALMAAGILFFYLSYGFVELTPATRELVPIVWGSLGILSGVISANNGKA